jgi:hypothetical protein
MPARSQAQRAYLNAKFGHDWVKRHGFDNKGKLPPHAPKHKGRTGTRSSITRERMISEFQRKHAKPKR